LAEFLSPSVVKVTLDARGRALNFSRAPIPFPRNAMPDFPAQLPANLPAVNGFKPLRHLGIYAYRVGFLRAFPKLSVAPLEEVESLEQLRALWHGYSILVTITNESPVAGVDTPADLERMRALYSEPHP
jgi:3-deoxy-manno-octulosonate cytidylyltransferase (CMP-KDO synthetase)